MSEAAYIGRVHPEVDIEQSLRVAAEELELGEPGEVQVIQSGYEDLVMKWQTSLGAHAVKFFAAHRTPSDLERIDSVLTHITSPGVAVRHPALRESTNDSFKYLHFPGNARQALIVMDWITPGPLTLNDDMPDEVELEDLAEQLARLHQAATDTTPVESPWLLSGMTAEYPNVANQLPAELRVVLDPIIDMYSEVEEVILPRAFVHGDLFGSNVLRGETQTLHIIDFSKASHHPRLYELAVTVANLLFNPDHPEDRRLARFFIDSYDQLTPLNDTEWELLPKYVLAAHASTLFAAARNDAAGLHTKENDAHRRIGAQGIAHPFQL